jgi:hypothetical protein
MRWRDDAMTYLYGADGRQMVAQRLARLRLPAGLSDDVTQEALLRVLRAEQRGIEPRNVDAFVTTLVHRTALDLLKGLLRRPEGHIAAAPEQEPGWDLADDEPDPVEQLVVDERLRELGDQVGATRVRLAGGLGVKPHPGAAALAVLAIVHGDATPAADCPTPRGGVAEEEGVWWAGVFYSGPDGCFATDGSAEDAKTRKRRSLALQATKHAMEVAVDDG